MARAAKKSAKVVKVTSRSRRTLETGTARRAPARTAPPTQGRRTLAGKDSSKRGARVDSPPSTIRAEILAYNAAQSGGDRRICETLATAIDRHLPGAESKIWHRHPVWFLDGNPIVGYHKLKDCVRLLFWSGRSFDEPDLAPEGGFQTAGARYISESEISAKDLKRWLAKSIKIQWDYKNIVKRKGRLERLK